MPQWLLARANHLHKVFVRPLWAIISIIIFTVLSQLITWRDELLSSETARQWHLAGVIKMLPNINLGWFVSIVAVAIITLLIEGSYRLWYKEHQDVMEMKYRRSSDCCTGTETPRHTAANICGSPYGSCP